MQSRSWFCNEVPPPSRDNIADISQTCRFLNSIAFTLAWRKKVSLCIIITNSPLNSDHRSQPRRTQTPGERRFWYLNIIIKCETRSCNTIRAQLRYPLSPAPTVHAAHILSRDITSPAVYDWNLSLHVLQLFTPDLRGRSHAPIYLVTSSKKTVC